MNKEYVGYIIAILSVIASGLISWYFYDKSLQYSIPTYSVDPFPSSIFRVDQKKKLPFKVVTNDGEPITESIYLATHYLWNQGEKAILDTDVLEDFVVTLNGDNLDILNASVSKMSRSVVNCSVSEVEKNKIRIKYKVLEKNDGCAIDLIYKGEQYPKVEMYGSIIGVDKFVMLSQTIDTYYKNITFYKRYKRFIPGLVLIIPYALFVILYLNTRNIPRQKFYYRIFMYVVLAMQVYFLAEIKFGSYYFDIQNEPPSVNNWIPETIPNKSQERTE